MFWEFVMVGNFKSWVGIMVLTLKVKWKSFKFPSKIFMTGLFSVDRSEIDKAEPENIV